MFFKKTKDPFWDYIEQIIDAAHELFLILDEDLKVVKANDRFYQFFQAAEHETEGKPIFKLGDGQWDIDKLKLLLGAIMDTDKNGSSQHKIYSGRFEKFIIDYNFPKIGRKTLVLNAKKIYKDKKTPMILLSMQDATSQKELENILMSVGNGLIVVDKDGNIAMVNKAFEEMLGWKQDEVLGKKMVDVVVKLNESEKPVPAEERFITQALSGQKIKPSNKASFFLKRNKEKIPINSIVTPIVISNEITGAVEVFRDVTEERELDKAKIEFVSVASHQLRTPLSTISWYTEMLLEGDAGKISAKQKKYLGEISRGNKRMVALVNSLLNVSRLELGTFMIQPEMVDIKEIAENTLHDLAMQIKNEKKHLKTNYQEGLPKINADPKLVRIVFDNLLSNALKYSPDGGNIELDISLKNPDILITVWNDGPGIPKEAQHLIFTKMFRDDLARQKDPDGNGLGLYIIKSILEHSGGSIRFESDEVNGTRFYATIPLSGMKQKEGTKAFE